MKSISTCLVSILLGTLPICASGEENKVWDFVTTGDGSTYAIDRSGSLWSWGWNESGQLGINGGDVKVSIPQDISNGKKWKFAVSGQAYAFFIGDDGTLWAVGDNSKGVSGVGDGTAHKVLTQVGADLNWESVAVTRFFGYSAFGIKTDGTLWAWGEGENGSLGLGNYTNVPTPKQVGADTDWKQVSVGQYFTVAIKNDGSLWGWGWNNRSQLPGHETHVKFPVQLGEDKNWTSVFAVAESVYGIKTDGSLWVWGYGGHNILGINNPEIELLEVPTKVSVVKGYVHSITGSENTRVVLVSPDGTKEGPRKVMAWGTNADGALGNGTGVSVENTDQISFIGEPVEVEFKENVNIIEIAGGEGFTIARDDTGKLWGWGKNRGGQLGDFSTEDQMTFVTSPIKVGIKNGEGQQDNVFTFTPETIPASLKGARKIILEGEWGTSDFTALTSTLGNNSGFPPAGNSTLEEVDMSKANIKSETSLYVPFGISNCGTFQGCRALTAVVMPSAEQAANFTNLKAAFQNCEALTDIDLTGCINVNVFDDTFFGCSSLTKVDLSNCKSITATESLFDKCASLKEVILPAQMTLSKYTFGGCTALETINWSKFAGDAAPDFPRDLFQYVEDLKKIKLYVPESVFDSFASHANWSALTVIAMSGIETITDEEDGNSVVQIFSFDGRYIGGNEIYEELPNGTYIIRTVNAKGIKTEKTTIQR